MNKQWVAATMLAAVMAAGVAHAAESEKKIERERCYGVAKAGKNDCMAKDKSNSCAGRAKKDNDPNNWVFVPKGLCDKLAGGVKS